METIAVYAKTGWYGGGLDSRALRSRRMQSIQWTPESWNMALGGLVLGSLILYLKGMRRMMFQLSGFYCRASSLLYGFRPLGLRSTWTIFAFCGCRNVGSLSWGAQELFQLTVRRNASSLSWQNVHSARSAMPTSKPSKSSSPRHTSL